MPPRSKSVNALCRNEIQRILKIEKYKQNTFLSIFLFLLRLAIFEKR